MKPFEDLLYLPPYDENVSYLAYPIILRENSKIDRKWIRNELEKRGIENRPLFGCLPTQQPVFSHLKNKYQDLLPVANYVGENAFYIGCHQYLKKEDLDYVVEVFEAIL